MLKIERVRKDEARRRLADVPDDKRFWCHDGKVLKNLKELARALSNMTDETFYYHLGGGRNDFSKWVKEVVGDARLAEELIKAKSRTQASLIVAKRISFLER